MSYYDTPSQTPLQDEVMDVQHSLSQVSLADSASPVSDAEALMTRIERIKNAAIGNCRLLYGSACMKFYDIIIAKNKEGTAFCAALMCSREGVTKVLRTSTGECPISAVLDLTECLQEDCWSLLMEGGAGAMMRGQQGHTEPGGQWTWTEMNNVERSSIVDDTDALPLHGGRRTDTWFPNTPTGPRANKRPRHSQTHERPVMSEVAGGLPYE